MAIPSVDRSAIERALEEFDSKLRATPDRSGWDTNRSQNWAIDHQGRKYPPKKIISMATGVAVKDFSGGPESNEYLAKRGISVTQLRSYPHKHRNSGAKATVLLKVPRSETAALNATR